MTLLFKNNNGQLYPGEKYTPRLNAKYKVIKKTSKGLVGFKPFFIFRNPLLRTDTSFANRPIPCSPIQRASKIILAILIPIHFNQHF